MDVRVYILFMEPKGLIFMLGSRMDISRPSRGSLAVYFLHTKW